MSFLCYDYLVSKELKAALLLLLISIIWGFAFSAQSLGADHLSPITFFAIRNVIAFITMGVFVFLIRHDDDLTDNAYSIKLGIVCGIVECAATLIQQFSITYTTAANCSFITSMYVVLVPIISLLLGKKAEKKIWLCVGMEIVGMYLLCVKEGFVINKGDVLAVFAAILFAVHIICIDQGGEKMDPILLCFSQFGVCTLTGVILLLAFDMPLNIQGIKDSAIPLLYTGILSSAVCLTIQVTCQKDLDPTVASLIMCLESVFGAIGGWIVLNEVLSTKEIIGCAIMFIAIVLSQLPSKSKT